MPHKYRSSIGLRQSVFDALNYLKNDDETWEDMLIFLISIIEKERKEKIQEDMRRYKENRKIKEEQRRKIDERRRDEELFEELRGLEKKAIEEENKKEKDL